MRLAAGGAALHNLWYTKVADAMVGSGEHHSFRGEWSYLRERVRYFEIIPRWELARIKDDVGRFFEAITAFRQLRIDSHGVEDEAEGYPYG